MPPVPAQPLVAGLRRPARPAMRHSLRVVAPVVFALITVIMLAGLIVARDANAAIRVEDDEVVFTVRAASTSDVFLIGDFNNWNPTLEKMQFVDGVFEVRLFLVAGSYRYRFVVDGRQINDPDNEPGDPARGSALELEERGGILVLAQEKIEEADAPLELTPSARYRGVFNVDKDGNTTSDNTLDVYLTFESERLRANADVRNESDIIGPYRFDRGFVEAKFGGLSMLGFENDTLWTSADPFTTVGRVGIFDYNVGYERKGVSAEWTPSSKFELRGMYVDRFATPSPSVRLDSTAFGDFANSSAADTTVYRFADTFNEMDSWAVEAALDFGSVGLGFLRRENRGMHPGLVSTVERTGSAFDFRTANTREDFDADVLWARWDAGRHFSLTVGYGASDARVSSNFSSALTDSTLDDIALGRDTRRSDDEVQFQTTDRWRGTLTYTNATVRVGLDAVWNGYDFNAPISAASQSRITLVTLDGDYRHGPWSIYGVVRYTDQDYGDTPVTFHYRTPTRNFWIDYLNRLDIHDIAGFDVRRLTDFGLSWFWGPQALPDRYRFPGPWPFRGRLDLWMTTDGFLERVVYWTARADVEATIRGRVYGQVDARVVHYDKQSWSVDGGFANVFLELGYRHPRFQISGALGLDPIVLDEVINDFNDNGRQEFLRAGIPPNLTRDDAAALGRGLIQQEEALRALQTRLQLEVVFLF